MADKIYDIARQVSLDDTTPSDNDLVSEYTESLQDPPMMEWTALKEH
jgi:hypothetical protein